MTDTEMNELLDVLEGLVHRLDAEEVGDSWAPLTDARVKLDEYGRKPYRTPIKRAVHPEKRRELQREAQEAVREERDR